MGAYDRYFSGELEDYEYPWEHVEEAIASPPGHRLKTGSLPGGDEPSGGGLSGGD